MHIFFLFTAEDKQQKHQSYRFKRTYLILLLWIMDRVTAYDMAQILKFVTFSLQANYHKSGHLILTILVVDIAIQVCP